MNLLKSLPIDVGKRRRVIHFLQIAGTTSSQVMELIPEMNEHALDMRIVPHRHDAFLRDIPRGAPYFFCITNPIARFVSGFYSRKSQGQNRTSEYPKWSELERRAFGDFGHANDLAEALFQRGSRGEKAFSAITSIRQIALSQIDYFHFFWEGNFLETRPPLFILRNENFLEDLMRLEDFLGLSRTVKPSERNPSAAELLDETVPELSERAKTNLHEWYRQDFEFYRRCDNWIERRVSDHIFDV